MKYLQISADLELLLLNAIMRGLLSVQVVAQEELSKEGKYVYQALKYLLGKAEPPVTARTVFVAATDVMGGDPDALRVYVRSIGAAGGSTSSAQLLEAVRTKQRLVRFINLASEQLGNGVCDTGRLIDALAEDQRCARLQPLADALDRALPDLPTGPTIKSLPRLTEETGGVFGFWALGGEPGVGKSTLALQIAVSLNQTQPVLYYDFEQGQEAMLSHLGLAFEKNVKLVKKATKQIYLRDSLRTLQDDLRACPPPALVVVDSIQKAPTSLEFRRLGLDQWIHRFEAIKRRGYTVLGVSEVQRGLYGEFHKRGGPQGRLSGFKESGEIEYAADIGIQLFQSEHGEHDVEVHLVKNRHRPNLGHRVTLERVNGWWFKERAAGYYNGQEVN